MFAATLSLARTAHTTTVSTADGVRHVLAVVFFYFYLFIYSYVVAYQLLTEKHGIVSVKS